MQEKPEPTPVRYPAIDPRHPHFLHGGDYSPEQWLSWPQILEEDFRMSTLAHVNSFTLGVFSWSSLEPEEGVFRFDWLDRVLDRMAERKMAAVLATPSGARPAWLSFKHPQVLRVDRIGLRARHEGRHNHCFTSPVYREKVAIIDGKLAERYHNHPALSVWHLSNEYSGECHCDLCYEAFRGWLRQKHGSLDALNQNWWTAFWSHNFSDWSQIEPQDRSIDGLMLDWKRFVTDQTVDFMKHEIAAIRQFSKTTPVTTNMMGAYDGLNYWKFAPALDVISWDAYPTYHDRADTLTVAAQTSMIHDINRSMKGGRPFMLMESTPSAQNWQPVNKLKVPGMHKLSSLQAVAHGADTVQYFQYRKNRGSAEKLHGAVIDHAGHENTRVFRDVAEVGRILEKLAPVIGTTVPAEVALVFDWESRWALEGASGPRRNKHYQETCEEHYRSLWAMGVPMDVIDADAPLDRYKIVIAPMLYMLRPRVADRIEAFVSAGGVFVTTHLTGIADENDRCFLGGWPGPLRKVLGVWAEEIDPLYDDEEAVVVAASENGAGLKGSYAGRTFCDLIHAEGAEVIATWGNGFYAGGAAIAVNRLGDGSAIYIATRADDELLRDLYSTLVRDQAVSRAWEGILPQGVTAQVRTDGARRFVFLLNFTRDPQKLPAASASFRDMLTGEPIRSPLTLPGYGVVILEQ